MKLLIVTQKADKNDPILGFFHRWIKEFAKHCEGVLVICLEKGDCEFPPNVKVLSLGKEEGRSRIKYLWRFYKYIWCERKNYDKVFVHMNQLYVILGFPSWRIWGKKVGLWYAHGHTPLSLRFAALLAEKLFTASKESLRLSSNKVVVTGHGIDTAFFFPESGILREGHWLSVGRLMPAKRHDAAMQEACDAGAPLRIAGSGPERARLESLAEKIKCKVRFLGPLSQSGLRDEYRRAAKLIHRSETGSLDKVVLEAAACGCPVDSSDPGVYSLPLSPDYVGKNHSLGSLIPRILDNLKNR